MGIRTDSQMARECRQGVMEFLLIIIRWIARSGSAGECQLQESPWRRPGAIALPRAQGKTEERRVGAAGHARCRTLHSLHSCIASCRGGEGRRVLGIVDRGSFILHRLPSRSHLDNNYSLKHVDICPVGALTSTDFRFKMRVWF